MITLLCPIYLFLRDRAAIFGENKLWRVGENLSTKRSSICTLSVHSERYCMPVSNLYSVHVFIQGDTSYDKGRLNAGPDAHISGLPLRTLNAQLRLRESNFVSGQITTPWLSNSLWKLLAVLMNPKLCRRVDTCPTLQKTSLKIAVRKFSCHHSLLILH
jgi:hypothetical protein